MTTTGAVLAAIAAAYGIRGMIQVARVPWNRFSVWCKMLPKPAEPHHVNLSRVVGTTMCAGLVFALWPLYAYVERRAPRMAPEELARLRSPRSGEEKLSDG